jgi:hypothetical protein
MEMGECIHGVMNSSYGRGCLLPWRAVDGQAVDLPWLSSHRSMNRHWYCFYY